jgi:Raf kinase inhibitor-like YbhB/YbcL family protein
MTLTSSDIAPEGAVAPAQIYPRCGGQNISPQLTWSGTPAGAKSLVLTMIDTSVWPWGWSHWIVVDIPPDVSSIATGAATLPQRAKPIVSNFGEAAYDGPCPPAGSGLHRYRLAIWALPTASFRIEPNMNGLYLRFRLQRAALDHATLTGTVRR